MNAGKERACIYTSTVTVCTVQRGKGSVAERMVGGGGGMKVEFVVKYSVHIL